MTAPARPVTGQDAGFTLIELLVALLLFGLISIAGAGLVETILGVERRTATRADRLAEIQRALFLVRSDFEQLSDGPVIEGDALKLVRNGKIIAFRISAGSLHRISGNSDRIILSGVGALRFRFKRADGAWSDTPSPEGKWRRPRGVEIVAGLAPRANEPSGMLRQVIELPAEP